MRIEEHKAAFEEHQRNIMRCIEEGIEENQRNIGYNVSQASVELFSMYLLKMKLVPLSVNFDHRTFKNIAAMRKTLSFDFPEKNHILSLMRRIEEKRNIICYGKRKPVKDIKEMLMAFNELKNQIGEVV